MNEKVNIHDVISADATPAFVVSANNVGAAYILFYNFTFIML